MRFSLFTSVLALAVASLAHVSSAEEDFAYAVEVFDDAPSNATLQARTSTTYYTDQCKEISGSYSFFGLFSINYDLGMVCLSSLDDYCDANNIDDYVKAWIKPQLSSCTKYSFPAGCQPSTSTGKYTCPQGTINTDGSCSALPASCGVSRCAQSDKSCCPTCTSKSSSSSSCSSTVKKSCTSPLTLSNGLCCASGYTGQTTVCCASGQTESTTTAGTCVCTDTSTKVSSSTGLCVSKCGTGLTYQSASGICCGSGATSVGGVCTCAAGYKYDTSLTPDACASVCSSGYSWCTSKCCKSYMSESTTGTCSCPISGYVDNGSACVNPCTSQQTLTSSGTCVNKCATGYTFSTSSTNTAGMCCTTGTTVCSTICCATGQIESNGHCCASGSTYNTNTKVCVAPSGTSSRKRRTFGLAQTVISASDADLNIDINLCPARLSACPISADSSSNDYECLDSFTDITSCGGCTSIGKGQDCSLIKGARFTGCEAGSCQVYSCRPGWQQVNGTSCERI